MLSESRVRRSGLPSRKHGRQSDPPAVDLASYEGMLFSIFPRTRLTTEFPDVCDSLDRRKQRTKVGKSTGRGELLYSFGLGAVPQGVQPVSQRWDDSDDDASSETGFWYYNHQRVYDPPSPPSPRWLKPRPFLNLSQPNAVDTQDNYDKLPKSQARKKIVYDDDMVVLRSSDGERSTVSLSLLSDHSTWFAEQLYKAEKSSIASNANFSLGVPTTAAALSVFLSLIQLRTDEGSPESASSNHLSLDNEPTQWAKTLEQVFAFADACQISTLPVLVHEHFERAGHGKDNVWILYALAAARNDKQLAVQLSRQTTLLKYSTISPHAVALLASTAPAYLARLETMHHARKVAWDECKKALRKKAPMENGILDFTKRCYSSGKCHGIEVSGGNFNKMRNMAANAAIHAMEQRGLEEDVMFVAVNQIVHCKSCFGRLTTSFGAAIRNTIMAAPNSVSE